ncbi:hypothetical protein LG943_11275 [Streptomonospora sp. S1-112]|uniref:Uncharacterized protein n=1 Tax=Streptomonospora mangrovi TaxID=2883123 RepID=A0A9X3SH64_9ACTN|nr:hypothetical protein [Streptomonospora mangrovi]MDA0564899.1 hypothetical protein [Streptomonospora mangrovi]
MSARGRLTPAQQEAILREVGRALAKAAPRNWNKVTLRCDALLDFCSTKTTAVLDDEQSTSVSTPPAAIAKMTELRDGMYSPGKGTWFKAVYILTRPGRFTVHYSHDEEPSFSIPAHDYDFLVDSRAYPRDSDSTPDWLRRRLAAALEAEAVAKADEN